MDLFGQVSTCTGRYQLQIFHCTNVHPWRYACPYFRSAVYWWRHDSWAKTCSQQYVLKRLFLTHPNHIFCSKIKVLKVLFKIFLAEFSCKIILLHILLHSNLVYKIGGVENMVKYDKLKQNRTSCAFLFAKINQFVGLIPISSFWKYIQKFLKDSVHLQYQTVLSKYSCK